MTLLPGTRFGPYEILTLVGSGGMGEVYRARDTRLDREVAIKVLRADASDEELQLLVGREARLIAGLNHPHICALFDIGLEGRTPYLVMELLDGETLATRLARGALSLDQALRYAVQIAGALDAAHRRRVVHRDLKPGNVMLTRAGAKLLDFGIARPGLADLQPISSDSTPTTPAGTPVHTSVGGTLPYMAPEQMTLQDVDARADIFSFGAILYEMVTGRRAFPGTVSARIVGAVLTEEPEPLTRHQPATPPALEELVRTCLAKDRDERWQSAHDLTRALTWIAEGSGTVPREEAAALLKRANTARPRARWLTAAAVVAIMTAAGVVSWRALPASGHPRHIVVLPCRALTGGSEVAFCDGIAETLTARLAQLSVTRDLQVARSSSVRRERVMTAEQARVVLGATLALEGSLLRAGDTLRLNYALIDPRTNAQIDAVSITAPAGDPFALQDQVVAWAMRTLQLRADPGGPQREGGRPQSAEVFSLYQSGRGKLAAHETVEDVDEAIAILAKATGLDSGYAPAQAALGEAYWHRYRMSHDPDWIERGRAACARALALAESLPEAHECLGEIALGTGKYEEAVRSFQTAADRDPSRDQAILGLARGYEELGRMEEAERVYRQVVERQPGYWAGHWWLGALLFRQARYADALTAFERAVSLNPANATMLARLGAVHMYLGHYDAAQKAFSTSNAIVTTPTVLNNWGVTLYRQRKYDAAAAMLTRACALRESYQCIGNLARAYMFGGKRREAEELLTRAAELAQRALGVNPRDTDAHLSLADFNAKLGRRSEALAHLQQVDAGHDPHLMFFVALVYTALGDRAAALEWLRKAVAAQVPRAELLAWPELDSLRQDAAFKSLVSPDRPGA